MKKWDDCSDVGDREAEGCQRGKVPGSGCSRWRMASMQLGLGLGLGVRDGRRKARDRERISDEQEQERVTRSKGTRNYYWEGRRALKFRGPGCCLVTTTTYSRYLLQAL